MDFENMDIGLSKGLQVGLDSENSLEGADLKSVVENTRCDPQDYEHLPFEEKLRLADVMIARWHRYREAVIEESSIPH